MSDHSTTRRDFLSGVAAATATAAIARPAAATSGTRKVRAAVIGSGARGSDLIRELSTIPTAEIVAVVDDYAPHLEQGRRFAGSSAKPYSNYETMLRESKPDAVLIAVPLKLHYEVASAALDAGAAVFCEKMLCYDLDDAQRLAATVKKQSAVFQVGLQRRANPIYQQAVAMVRSGVLGQLTAIRAQWHRNNNWRRPVPVAKTDPRWGELEKRLNWRLYRQWSRGLLAELGSHQLDVVQWMLDAAPSRVQASGGVDYWLDGRDVADNVVCVYDFPIAHPTATPAAPGASAASAARPPAAVSPSAASPRSTIRVTYSSLCNNAYEGASELILGTHGSLFLTATKGLLYREPLPEQTAWLKSDGQSNAAQLTAGKTLKMSNSPWAHRGQPLQLDAPDANDTREQLVSFIDHVARQDPATICDVDVGLANTATVLMAEQAIAAGEKT